MLKIQKVDCKGYNEMIKVKSCKNKPFSVKKNFKKLTVSYNKYFILENLTFITDIE